MKPEPDTLIGITTGANSGTTKPLDLRLAVGSGYQVSSSVGSTWTYDQAKGEVEFADELLHSSSPCDGCQGCEPCLHCNECLSCNIHKDACNGCDPCLSCNNGCKHCIGRWIFP